MFSNQTIKFFTSFVKKTPDLTGQEKYVLVKRLKQKPLEAVGQKFALTEGRIRQIERQAIKKLKSKARQLTLFRKHNQKNPAAGV